jgi:hypothetical protein
MSASSPSPYRLSTSEHIRGQIRALGVRFFRAHRDEEFKLHLDTVVNKLQTQPLEWGDPQYRLRGLELLMCHAYTQLRVYYGVDERNRIVYIKEVLLMPNIGLGE